MVPAFFAALGAFMAPVQHAFGYRGRSICIRCCSNDLRALPPAEIRDIAAEAITAASVFRPSSVPLYDVPEQRKEQAQLVLIMLVDEPSTAAPFQQLVAEVVSNITSGKRAGSSWLRPLALRSSLNATMAQAAWEYDPCIGWCGSDDGSLVVPSNIHMFSRLAPDTFVSTSLLRPVPTALALAVRSMSEAHADSCTDYETAATLDSTTIHMFMRAVAATRLGTTSLYDPLE